MKFVLTFEMAGGLHLNGKNKLAYHIGKSIDQLLQTKEYGVGLLKFHLVIKLLTPELATAFPPGQYYRPRKKEVLIAPLVDILRTIESSENEWKEMVCKEILIAVSRFREIGVKNFDQEAFQEDLVKFFGENGWMT